MDRSKRKIAAAAGFLLLLSLILFITAATVVNIAGDKALLAVEMRRHSTPKVTGLPEDQYSEMGQMIAEYLTGKIPTFQYYLTDKDGSVSVCFHPYEANHMADCRRLISLTGKLKWIPAGLVLICIGAGVALRKYRRSFSNGLLAALAFSALIIVLVVAWGLVSFNSLFTAFHRLLFTNEDWLLDARTDMLVRLMPASFFVSMGIRLLLAISAVALLGFSSAMMMRMAGTGEEEQEEHDGEAEPCAE